MPDNFRHNEAMDVVNHNLRVAGMLLLESEDLAIGVLRTDVQEAIRTAEIAIINARKLALEPRK